MSYAKEIDTLNQHIILQILIKKLMSPLNFFHLKTKKWKPFYGIQFIV